MAVRWPAVLIALAVTVGSARADDAAGDGLARAKQLEAQLEYDQALAIVDRLLAAGGADPARYVELHLLAGRLAAGLDRSELAREHFARVLAVRPDTTLPEGTSPKITQPFAAARARSTPLSVEVTSRGGLVTLEARDPLGIVVGIAVHVVTDGVHSDVVERTARRVVLPAGAKALEVAALDASGNRVWIGAPPSAPALSPPPPPHASPGLFRRWPTYAVLGATALAVGGIGAWRFGVAQDEFDRRRDAGATDFTELQAIETRGKRWALAANIGFGVAAASAVAAVIAGITGREQADVTVSPTTVSPTTETAGVTISGRF